MSGIMITFCCSGVIPIWCHGKKIFLLNPFFVEHFLRLRRFHSTLHKCGQQWSSSHGGSSRSIKLYYCPKKCYHELAIGLHNFRFLFFCGPLAFTLHFHHTHCNMNFSSIFIFLWKNQWQHELLNQCSA